MDARTIYTRLQPLNLIVEDQVFSSSGKYVDELSRMRRTDTWDRLDALAETIHGSARIERYDPILLLHLADAYLEAGRLKPAEQYSAEALGILECGVDLACHQNRAVATSYLGLSFHSMNRFEDALHYYEKSQNLFKETGQKWHSSSPGFWRASQCANAADEIKKCADELLASIMGQGTSPKRSGGFDPGASLKPGPVTYPRPSPTQLLGIGDIVFLIALLSLPIIWLGYGIFLFQGAIALIIYGVTIATMAAVAVLIARSSTRAGILLNVPQEQAVIVREGNRSTPVWPGQQWILIPWFHRVRFRVPLTELTCTLAKQKVALGQDPKKGGSASVSMTIQARYEVFDPVRATSFIHGSGDNDKHQKKILGKEELEKKWESRLRTELTPLLTNQLWGATVSDCCDHREKIQENIRNELTVKSRRWGVDVTEVTILEVNAQ